jgi:hypothetical protein
VKEETSRGKKEDKGMCLRGNEGRESQKESQRGKGGVLEEERV